MFDKKTGLRLIVCVLTLLLVASGCANFPPRRATEPPLPTDTPLSPVVEPTSTPTAPLTPTEKATLVVGGATLEPTITATVTGTSQAPSTATPTQSSSTPMPTSTAKPSSKPIELLINGNFEEGFAEDGVGLGWSAFSNGNAHFGWLDDTWSPVVWQGEHSQLLYIADPSQNDRYIGIYQTVQVMPNQVYTLTLRGLVRANTPAEDYGHRLHWGMDYDGGSDWQVVDNWFELPWDQQPEVADAFNFGYYTTVITSTSPTLTLFLRGHTKWVRYGQADFNLDGLSLVGLPPGPLIPETGGQEFYWVPIVALIILLFILLRESQRGARRWREKA